MEDPNSTLLPYILETLSRKPELCDTFDNICKEIEDQLRVDKNTRYGNIRNALQRALNVGQSLGIITLSHETIRMPFNFRSTSVAKGKARDDVQQVQQPPIGTGNPPVAQNTNERSAAALPKKRSREVENSFFSRRRDPDYMSSPPMRHRQARGRPRSRPRARKTARKPIRRRPYHRRR
ncbi:uncharacterized protein LOC101461244 [Ceratitis capitata]|uniref:Uncharacterized protein n=1 Tax=Ceratitis capitata TaxID=7213 RepID=W8BJT8_CERCA|nr:uncharacterized protein LOC101461244 [Ceratitis capitata]